MIEIGSRWGLSKEGNITLEDKKIAVPNVLFLSGDEMNPPDDAEVALSVDDGTMTIAGSFFGGSSDRTIPTTFSYPFGTEGTIVDERGGDERVQILFDQEPDPEAELYVIGNAPKLLSRSKDLYRRIAEIRRKIDLNKILYLPGIAHPRNIALFTYLGVDLFDSAFCEYLSSRGISVDDWMDAEGDGKENNFALQREIKNVREAVEKGYIRELVETRIRPEPWMVEVLRFADDDYELFSTGVPVTGGKIKVTTREGLNRPDIKRFQRRLRGRYTPPNRDVLLLLPCSARKPYFLSRSHKRFRDAVQAGDWTNIHEVILTSPMGAVPRELEQFYPAQNYDIPVTSKWFEEEREVIVSGLNTILEKGGYNSIISHLPSDMDFVESNIPENIDHIDTTDGDHPTDDEALKRLSEAVRELAGKNLGHVKGFLNENLTKFADFQFGKGGEALTEGAVIKGRYPYYKIIGDEGQRGMIVAERGLISLTIEGASILKDKNVNLVEIDDFVPKGTVFAVGVKDADPGIRPEDECIVVHDGDLRGVGPAVMSGPEMKVSDSGGAVRIRHYSK